MSRESTREGSIDAGASHAGPVDAPIFEAGTTIGARYRLLRLIAKGGMGEVYEADDLELKTRVAIKTIRAERLGDANAGARLKQEILAARKITHPNVVRLFDVGFHVLPDGREIAFFTMELLAGESLDAVIRAHGGPLPRERILAIARQLAVALDASHAAGIVHRDFKSPNVMIVDGDRAIVTDFGLARDRTEDADATKTVELAGTPAYMAPEQVTRSHAIGPAADIYAFGVVLFEMATGKLPFSRDTALATAAARIEQPAPRPRSVASDLPRAWDAAIARCLDRDPAARFATASAAVAALSRRFIPWRILAVAAAAIAAAIFLLLPATSACDAPSLPDIYVDAKAAPGGTGSKACPLRTITSALAVAADRRTIHVAAGYYDRALGEQFPLVVRGETSLVGAGRDATTIGGVGDYDSKPNGGTVDSTHWRATIVAGDTVKPITIANLALSSGLPSTQTDVAGILCTRGARDAPNTRLADVTIGPNYTVALLAGTERVPVDTACNIDIARSRFHGGQLGIWQVGCGVGTTGERTVLVGVRIHDSDFEGFRNNDPVFLGSGVSVWDCASGLVVERSTFSASDAGLVLIRHEGEVAPRFDVHDNQFKDLSRSGIEVALAVHADIRRNKFSDITGAGEYLGRAAAIHIVPIVDEPPSLVVRDNEFHENDLAIEFAGTGTIAPTSHFDFGTAGDPGNNVFYCNAAPEVSPAPGGDVAIRTHGTAPITLAGNAWDHAPPTRGTSGPNGLDVLEPAAPAPAVDTGDARLHRFKYCTQRVR